MDRKLKFKGMQIGANYDVVMLLGGMVQKTARNGNPFMEISLSDGDENVIARKFSCTEAELSAIGVERDMLVKLMVNVGEYNGCKNYTISTIAPAYGTTLTIEDFVVKAPIDVELAFEELIMAVQGSHEDSMHDFVYNPISLLTEDLLVENKDAFCKSSAAKMVHHNVVGGLLFHTLTMVKNAEKIVETYHELDRELLICGAALHDIGKIYEMNTTLTGAAEYTRKGRLLGHATIGIMMIEDEKRRINNYDSDRVELLEHMLASHHGQLECGAITTPAIPEAMVLHALDMIDSRVYMFNNAYKDMEDGMLSGSIYGLDNSSVFKAPPAFQYEESNEYWEKYVSNREAINKKVRDLCSKTSPVGSSVEDDNPPFDEDPYADDPSLRDEIYVCREELEDDYIW